ncbi:MAG TPA: glycosyl hydrolase 53 family protein [Verrucomicrobiae bacterium]|jgi:arabinogalactan endo-1,4-beta-galactosidase
MRRITVISIVIAATLAGEGARAGAANFLSGADFSFLSYFESLGVTYKDAGQTRDGLQILKDHGIQCVRLRLFTSSAAQGSADPYDYINNTAYTVPLAVRVKNAGLRLLLDFHFSDTWADPGHQATPAAWTNLSVTQLAQTVRIYTSNTIATFAAAGAMPDYVQIGNEITSGMLWPLGYVSSSGGGSWPQLGELMFAAIRGVQEASGANMPKIIIHIDRGGDWPATMWFFDNLNAQSIPFDIIGESYYTFFQGAPTSLSNCLNNAAARYGKPIMVAEDAFPWTNACPASWTNSLYGFPPTTAGQVAFIAAVASIVEGVTNHLGAGFFYWGAEYQAAKGVNEAGYNTASFFDAAGNVLSVADAVGGMSAPLQLSAIADGASLRLQWPFSGAASTLMTATNIAGRGQWSPAGGSLQTTGAVFTLTLPVTNQARFYRLQSK